MIRLQDIADMVGVSRTTVSNVLHGNTKRVSQDTIDKIRKIIDEQGYIPNMGSRMLAGQGSKIIGFVLGYEEVHGYPANMDSFIGELLAAVRQEAERQGYYIMIIGGKEQDHVVDIASRWNIEGLVLIGYSEDRYAKLRKKLNKKAVLIDTYTELEEYNYQNVGTDDFDGGYQIGKYLRQKGFTNALFLAEETKITTDDKRSKRNPTDKFPGRLNEYRWMGFKKAMEEKGNYCSLHRFVVVDQDKDDRLRTYKEMLPKMLEAGAVACASDYNAIELINFLHDAQIRVPEQISVTGFDDCIYCEYVRPRLTTIHQDVSRKGRIATKRLIRMLKGEELAEFYIKENVKLIIRDSVRAGNSKK